jgi:hypothetical protein
MNQMESEKWKHWTVDKKWSGILEVSWAKSMNTAYG